MSKVVDRESAKQLIDALPEGATWDDLAQAISLRILIEERVARIGQGKSFTNDEVRARYNLDE